MGNLLTWITWGSSSYSKWRASCEKHSDKLRRGVLPAHENDWRYDMIFMLYKFKYIYIYNYIYIFLFSYVYIYMRFRDWRRWWRFGLVQCIQPPVGRPLWDMCQCVTPICNNLFCVPCWAPIFTVQIPVHLFKGALLIWGAWYIMSLAFTWLLDHFCAFLTQMLQDVFIYIYICK